MGIILIIFYFFNITLRRFCERPGMKWLEEFRQNNVGFYVGSAPQPIGLVRSRAK